MQGLRMSALFLLPMLGWNTVTDLKRKQISLLSVILFGLTGIVLASVSSLRSFFLKESLESLIAGAAIGALLLLLSRLTRGAVSFGDGLIFAVLGLYLGIFQVVLLLFLSCFAAGITGTVLLIMGRADQKSRLPLVPFVLISYMALLAL
ncbi:MAG: prepilin peptidase [Lachnospiraceae bacterium]|nr:prepilin peptidase [Lachnospiraceae bacterium]